MIKEEKKNRGKVEEDQLIRVCFYMDVFISVWEWLPERSLELASSKVSQYLLRSEENFQIIDEKRENRWFSGKAGDYFCNLVRFKGGLLNMTTPFSRGLSIGNEMLLSLKFKKLLYFYFIHLFD